MDLCPVCSTEYTNDKIEFCTTCGWNVSAYPQILGQMPKIFQKREQQKLVWARQTWKKLEQFKQEQSYLSSQVAQLQTQLEQEKTLSQGQFHRILEQLEQAVVNPKFSLSPLEERLAGIEAKLNHLSVSNTSRESSRSQQQETTEATALQSQLDAAKRQITDLKKLLQTERQKWQLPERQSERGVDFRRLEWLLVVKSWEEADKETWELILKICGEEAVNRQYITNEDIDNISIQDMKIINELWWLYSNGQYGFSAQWKAVNQNKKKGLHFKNPSELGYYPAGHIVGAIGVKGLSLILMKLAYFKVF